MIRTCAQLASSNPGSQRRTLSIQSNISVASPTEWDLVSVAREEAESPHPGPLEPQRSRTAGPRIHTRAEDGHRGISGLETRSGLGNVGDRGDRERVALGCSVQGN